jgi:hypothetical protein
MPPTRPSDAFTTNQSEGNAATDAFLERYVEWREACLELRWTQRRWSAAAPVDRRIAFAAHRASLEREAAAAEAYATASEQVSRPRADTAPVAEDSPAFPCL